MVSNKLVKCDCNKIHAEWDPAAWGPNSKRFWPGAAAATCLCEGQRLPSAVRLKVWVCAVPKYFTRCQPRTTAAWELWPQERQCSETVRLFRCFYLFMTLYSFHVKNVQKDMDMSPKHTKKKIKINKNICKKSYKLHKRDVKCLKTFSFLLSLM